MEAPSPDAFTFNKEQLAFLAMGIPADIQLLRLRPRFGLPTCVAVGQRFSIAVDVVDEMGQPVAISAFGGDTKSIRPRIRVVESDRDAVEPQTDELTNSQIVLRLVDCVTSSNSSSGAARWSFDAMIEHHATSQVISAAIHLVVELQDRKSSLDCTSSAESAFRQAASRFCARSVWLGHSLMLPFQSEIIKITTPVSGMSSPSASTTTTCRRFFRLPPAKDTTTTTRARIVTVTENYGDTMGSHIWDASVFLSLALCHATDSVPPSIMVELGAGCGLFAAVFRALFGSTSWLVLTERSESTALLTANLALNAAPVDPPILVASLHWGVLSLPTAISDHVVQDTRDVVLFAADVLYHWDAHSALLATLETLARQWTGSNVDNFQAILAHKHRGETTSRALERVVNRQDDLDVALDPWNKWRVERIARLGRVDLLRLSLKREFASGGGECA